MNIPRGPGIASPAPAAGSTVVSERSPMIILSIDGGGIRAVIPARFLARLEQDMGAPVGRHIGLAAGTSAGAMLTLFLTGVNPSAQAAAAMFTPRRAQRIMDRNLLDRIVPAMLAWWPKYDGKGKRDVLDRVFGDTTLGEVWAPSLAIAFDPATRSIREFRSMAAADQRLKLSDVANASTAAPGYFPSVSVDGLPQRSFVDGGVASNNPAMAALSEALAMGYRPDQITLISLGTGTTHLGVDQQRAVRAGARTWGSIDWLLHGVTDDLVSGASSGVDFWCGRILGERYVRVQPELTGVDPAMDAVSDENIRKLEMLGDTLYEQQGGRVRAALHAPDPITLQPLCIASNRSARPDPGLTDAPAGDPATAIASESVRAPRQLRRHAPAGP